MNYTSKGIIDAACCGEINRNSAEEARQFIEDIEKETTELHLRLQGAVAD